MNDHFDLPDDFILTRIILVRGKKVIMDKDLAALFEVKPRRLREQVRRNTARFPEHFMFELTENEVDSMVSQNATPGKKYFGGSLPMVFTEYGVLQAANVLNSAIAVQMSIRIIELFVRLREMVLTHRDILIKLDQLENQVGRNSEDIRLIFSALKELISQNDGPRPKIGFRK